MVLQGVTRFHMVFHGVIWCSLFQAPRWWWNGKSFSNKKGEKRAGVGERQGIFPAATAPFPKSCASYFRFARFNTFPLYYLRAWHRLYMVLHGVTVCYMVSHRVTGCYIAIRFYIVLHGVSLCCMVLQGVTGCYMVLRGVTWCYTVLH